MKAKCQIIPVSVYDKTPPVVHEDDKWRYILGSKGHLIRLRRKTCSICPASMAYVVIFEYAKHRKVERYCAKCAQEFGEVPDIPQPEISKDISQITVKALQRWNMQ